MPQLNIQIGGNATGFFATLNQVRAASANLSTSLGNSLKGGLAGLAGGFGVAAMTQKALEYGGKLADMSERLGVSTDALQEFDFAMSQSGGTIDDAATALKKLAVARKAALEDSNSDAFAAFRKLGVDAAQLKNARLEDLFRQIGLAVRDAADPQTVLADALVLLGKNSDAVLSAMRADLDAAAESARNLGLIIGEDIIAQLDEIGDRADTFGRKLIATFAPLLTWMADAASDVLDVLRLLGEVIVLPGVAVAAAIRTGSLGEGLEIAARQMADNWDRIIEQYEARQRPRERRDRSGLNLEEGGQERGANPAVRDAERALRLRERIAKMERDALPLAERRKAIEEEIARLQNLQAIRADEGAGDDAQQAELRLHQLELENELRGLDARHGSGSNNADRFTRIGVFSQRLTGSVPRTRDPAQAIEQQKPLLQAIALNTGRAADNTHDTARALA